MLTDFKIENQISFDPVYKNNEEKIFGIPKSCYDPLPLLPQHDLVYIISLTTNIIVFPLVIYSVYIIFLLLKDKKGIPRNSDSIVALGICASSCALFFCSLNPFGIRLGVPFTSLAGGIAGIIGYGFIPAIASSLYSSRKVYNLVQGKSDVSKKENILLHVLICFMIGLSAWCIGIYFLSDIGIIDILWTQRVNKTIWSAVGIKVVVIPIIGFTLLVWVRRKNSIAAQYIVKYGKLWFAVVVNGSIVLYGAIADHPLHEDRIQTCYRTLVLRIFGSNLDQLKNELIMLNYLYLSCALSFTALLHWAVQSLIKKKIYIRCTFKNKGITLFIY